MLQTQANHRTDAFEIVSFKFKDNTSFEEQNNLMVQLNDIVKKFDGFKSRDFYFSEDNGRWIDCVIWSDAGLAKLASESVMSDPAAGVVFSKIDEASIIFSHYQWIGGIEQK